MKTSLLLLLAALPPSLIAASTQSFDGAPVGQPPPGWTVAITGKGEPEWTVEADASAPSSPAALKQSAQVPGPSFPLCLKDGAETPDGFVEVRFKTLSGRGDQAAGVVWRARDADNYYVCRANALEDNVVLYKVEKGKRSSLGIVGRRGGYGVEVKVAPRTWHTLRVEFSGSRFEVLLNGKHLFEAEDTTFAGAGRVGLWTKADSVVSFDNFSHGAN